MIKIELKKLTVKIFLASPPPTTIPPPPAGCSIDPNGAADMPEYPPFITDASDNLVVTNGTDDDRAITINQGESAFLTCPQENFLNHPSEATLEIRQILVAL